MRIATALLSIGAVALAGCHQQPAGPPGEDMALAAGPVSPGKAVFDQWCAGCHKPMPPAMKGAPPGPVPFFPPAGTEILQKRYKGSIPAALEQRTDLTPELIRATVRQGVGIMPPTRKSEVTDGQLDALAGYLTHRRGG